MTHTSLAKSIVALLAAACLTACASSGQLETGATGAAIDRPQGTRSTSAGAVSPGTVERNEIGEITGQGALAGSASTGQGLKVALLLPLGGFDQTAVISKGMKQAAELALFDSGRADVQLIVKDDKGTPEGARVAADEAINEGAEIVLGPLLGRAVPGAAAVARASNVPVLTFSNDRTVAGNGVYVMGFSPEQDAERVAGYAARQGKSRFAVLVPDDTFGSVTGEAFKSAVARSGGTITAFETYPAGANAMIGPSRRIVEAARAAEGAGAPIDAVFLPGGQDVLSQLGPLLTYSGFDAGKVKLLGSGAWEFATLGSNPAFVGGWYPGPDPASWREFQAKFSKAFGGAPPRVASLAYDAMQLAMTLSRDPPGQRFTVANLTRPGGFAGVDGTMRLTSSGVIERSLAIHEVQKVGSTIIEAAPPTPESGTSGVAPDLDGRRFSGTPPRVN